MAHYSARVTPSPSDIFFPTRARKPHSKRWQPPLTPADLARFGSPVIRGVNVDGASRTLLPEDCGKRQYDNRPAALYGTTGELEKWDDELSELQIFGTLIAERRRADELRKNYEG